MEYEGLVIAVSPSVYEPAEDSFLLARHAARLRGRILDVGCGSGIAALHNAKLNPENEVIGVDVSPEAVACAGSNAKINGIGNIQFFESDLFSKIQEFGKFDAILFNPPYLPTTKRTRLKTNLNLAFDGGKSGRKLLGRFLAGFEGYLAPDGAALLIHSSLNGLDRTITILEKKGFESKILETAPFFFEKLYVLKITKRKE